MLKLFQSYFLKRALRRTMAERRRVRRTHTFGSARSIGILFDAGDEKSRRALLDFARSLEKEGKTAQLLGFFSETASQESAGFDAFSARDIRWNGQLNSDKANAFADKKFDLLLCYNPNDHLVLAWLVARNPASMKIGAPTELPNDYDLMFETPADKGARFFLEHLPTYLDKLVLPHHEPARAL